VNKELVLDSAIAFASSRRELLGEKGCRGSWVTCLGYPSAGEPILVDSPSSFLLLSLDALIQHNSTVTFEL